jgi:LPXTG-site transpeptidase (sortase) family protein
MMSTPTAKASTTPSAMRSSGMSFMVRSTPTRITIAKIAVHSNLMKLGLKSDGTLQVPPAAFPAGWYVGAPTPGQQGPAVIVGHVHWNGRAGVFARLGQLRVHDRITVLRADGQSVTFEVTSTRVFAKSHFPTALVYGNVNDAELRLITCGGYDRVAHKYEANLVVFARRVG